VTSIIHHTREVIKLITIEIKAATNLNGDNSLYVTFPYDLELISVVKRSPFRHYDPATKTWELPEKQLPKILEGFGNRPITIKANIDTTESKVIELPEGFNFKTKPFSHQLEGLEYGLNNGRFLLGDEQGLGKTKQVIDIAVARKLIYGYKHCLIITGVNGLKWNWRKEVATHSNEKAWILGTRYNSKGKEYVGSNLDKLEDLNHLPDSYFLITNVESLRHEGICNKIQELCKKGVIGIVAIDEIHKCKNPSSQQGKAILKIQPKDRIAMTGTPLMNTPLDLYIVLKWLGYEKHSFYQFKKHFCIMGGYGGYEVIGYKNLSELREQVDTIMLRRLKKDVLDLPDKIYTTDYVEMSPAQEKIYNDVLDEIRDNIDKIKLSNNPLAQLIRLRQATGFTGILSSSIKESAKLDRLEELVEEITASGRKVIVFSNWTDVTKPAYERLKRYNPAYITGETVNRVEEENRFQNDPRCKVIIGTIGAMGTGLTLTAADTVIFLDEPWNRALKEQAEDRAHRIGTASNVNIITLVCQGTIDEKISQLIQKKGAMADMLVDGKVPEQNKSELIDWLIS